MYPNNPQPTPTPTQPPQPVPVQPQPAPVQPVAPIPQPQVYVAPVSTGAAPSKVNGLLGIAGAVISIIALVVYPIILGYAETYWILLIVTVLGLAAAGAAGFALHRTGEVSLVKLTGFIIGVIMVVLSVSQIAQSAITENRIKALRESMSSLEDSSSVIPGVTQ